MEKGKKIKTQGNKVIHDLPAKVPVALIEHSTNPPEYYVQVGSEIKEVLSIVTLIRKLYK